MRRCLLTGTIAIFACCSMMGLAQEAAKPAAAKPAAEKTDSKADAKKGRLPANYGKLGLTDPQKTKIYGIQNSYDGQLDELQAKIDALKAKRDQEVEAVLTEDQRKILKNLVEANKEAKAKGKQDPVPAKSDATKADAPKDSKK